MKQSFGVPYQGSKNRLAKELVALLPSGERFVDLFAGGCAMTHAAIFSGKYKSFLVNDKYPYGLRLFKMDVNGELDDPKYLRWVSREEFEKEKDTDPFVKLCWSFSNNGKNYMYNKNLEPTKRALHYAVVYDDWTYIEQLGLPEAVVDALKKSVEGKKDWNERRLAMTHAAFDNKVIGLPRSMLQNLERLNKNKDIQAHMVCFNRANNLRSIDLRIEYTEKDYRDYEYREGDVVYCDPPYKGVACYDNNDFNSDEFYEWVRTREYPIYFSEYTAPDDFVEVFRKEVQMKFAPGQTRKGKWRVEKLYIHKKWL